MLIGGTKKAVTRKISLSEDTFFLNLTAFYCGFINLFEIPTSLNSLIFILAWKTN